MIHVQCPEIYDPTKHPGRTLFLAGGITGVWNWQAKMLEKLSETDLVLLNPRRKNFDSKEISTEEQVGWEYNHLLQAERISFWFSFETVQPIALYELGYWAAQPKKLFVGYDPDYSRRHDIRVQLGLQRPDIQVTKSLPNLVEQIIQWHKDEQPS